MSKAVLIPECNKDIGGMKEEICVSPSDKKDGAIGLISRFFRLDALGKRHSADSPPAAEPPAKYYGVYIPCEDKKGPDVGKLKKFFLELIIKGYTHVLFIFVLIKK